MKLRNISPMGHLDLPGLGLVLEPGEVFEVDDEVAGRAPSVEVVDDVEVVDPGEGLLAQVGNFEAATGGTPSRSWKRDDLYAHAIAAGIDVDPDATKTDLLSAIKAGSANTEEPS